MESEMEAEPDVDLDSIKQMIDPPLPPGSEKWEEWFRNRLHCYFLLNEMETHQRLSTLRAALYAGMWDKVEREIVLLPSSVARTEARTNRDGWRRKAGL